MFFRKLWNLVSRQAKAAASDETTVTQTSSDDKQPKPTLVCNPRSSSAIAEVSLTIVTTKVHKRKGENTENEGDEAPVTTATNKGCKRKRKNSESQSNSDPFGLMIN